MELRTFCFIYTIANTAVTLIWVYFLRIRTGISFMISLLTAGADFRNGLGRFHSPLLRFGLPNERGARNGGHRQERYICFHCTYQFLATVRVTVVF